MTTTDVKTVARRVLEEVFPANDDAALATLISDRFVNHEAPPGTPPGPGGLSMAMHMLNDAFSDQRWTIHQGAGRGRHRRHLLHAQRTAHR